MARLTAAETSSREGTRCPHMGSFNLWNKSKSGGLRSGLYGMWGNTSHLYLLSKSVTTFPRWGNALSCKMSGPSPSKSGQFLCLCFLFLFSSLAVRDPSCTNFSFLQIVCQNMEYWCWWNPGSLWYFPTRHSMILCKNVRHKFHTSFICWCFRPS